MSALVLERVLVTGFGPFGSVQENPSSWLAARSGAPYHRLEVSFRAVDRFLPSIDPDAVDAILLMGVAVGRPRMSVELIARNWVGMTADVTGENRTGHVSPGAPAILPGTLWTAQLVQQWFTEGIAEPSDDAGGFLCNYLYYQTLRHFPEHRVGFLHVADAALMPPNEQLPRLRHILRDLTTLAALPTPVG